MVTEPDDVNETSSPSGDRGAKIAFVISLAVLAFLLGYVARGSGWFQGGPLERAWDQAGALFEGPHSLEDRVYDWSGVRVRRPEEISPGPTLLTGMFAGGGTRPGAKILDRDGQVLHEWPIDAAGLFPSPPASRTHRRPDRSNIHGVHLYPNGDLVFNLSYVGTARIDACGDPVWTLAVGSHHSVERTGDGTLWIAGGVWDSLPDGGSIPSVVDSVYRDRLIRVSEDGEVLEELDVLRILLEGGLIRHLPKGSRTRPHAPKTGDITHLNDVDPLPDSLAEEYPLFEDGDLAVSLHHLDLVMVLDPGTGRVRWHDSHPFIQQHDPDWIGEGWIGVFDNNRDGTERGTLAGGSRIVAVQPHTDSTRVLFPTDRSDPFYTDVQGKWQLLPNGNMLLAEASAGRVVEVNPVGQTVWEWVVEPYSETKTPEVTEARRLPFGREHVASWGCGPEGREVEG